MGLETDEQVIYLGTGLSLRTPFLEGWTEKNEFRFIIGGQHEVTHPNVRAVPHSDPEGQNYIACSDIALIKLGYSSVSYVARWAAKNVVAAGLADECEIQIAYAIGVAKPLCINLDTKSTNKIPEIDILDLIKKHFDFRPGMVIDRLKLRRPIYAKTAAYGHFGRDDPDFTWEKRDVAQFLREDAGL